MRPPHPVDLINAVRRSRGEAEGPPHDMVTENRNIFLPELEDDQQPALKAPSLPLEAIPSVPRPLMPTSPTVGPAEGPPLSDQNEGVSLSDGAGFYQGHELRLSPAERKALRRLLGKVVLRQLKAERARVAQGLKG